METNHPLPEGGEWMTPAAHDARDMFHWMLSFACWEPTAGHGWKPSEVLENWSDEAAVGGRPGCPKCRRIWHSKLTERGVGEELQRYLFDKIGAKWLWDPKEVARSVRREVWISPDRKVGDRIRFHSEHLTTEQHTENRDLESERKRIIAIREKALEQGMELFEAIQNWPLPDKGKHVHNFVS